MWLEHKADSTKTPACQQEITLPSLFQRQISGKPTVTSLLSKMISLLLSVSLINPAIAGGTGGDSSYYGVYNPPNPFPIAEGDAPGGASPGANGGFDSSGGNTGGGEGEMLIIQRIPHQGADLDLCQEVVVISYGKWRSYKYSS